MSQIIDLKKDTLESTISELKLTAKNVSNAKSTMERSTNTLLADWMGKSKNAFETEYKALISNLGEYDEVLLNMANTLSTVKTSFEEQDKAIANAFRQE